MAVLSLRHEEGLSLSLPLESAYLTTARLFAAAAARQLLMDEEAIEDVKLAISEVCTAAITAQPPGADGQMELRITAADGRIRFRLATLGPGAFEPAPPGANGSPRGLSDAVWLEITRAMFADTHVEATEAGGTAVSFSAPLSSPPG